jgi:hypothetical protein
VVLCGGVELTVVIAWSAQFDEMATQNDQDIDQEVNYGEYSDADIQSYIQAKEQEIQGFLNQ